MSPVVRPAAMQHVVHCLLRLEISLPCHPAVSCNAKGISVRAVGRPMALSSGQSGSVVGLLLQLRTLFCVGSTYAQLLLRPVRLLPLAVCLCRPRPAGDTLVLHPCNAWRSFGRHT